MSIQSYINSLKEKPDHIRSRYAFWTAFSITAVIFAFWLGSFSAFGNSTQSAVATAVNKAGTPAQSMIAGVGSFFTDIKDIILAPKKVEFKSVDVRPGNK